MITSIHPPEFFSKLKIWNQMYLSDIFILYDTSYFNDKSYQYRCKLETFKSPTWFALSYNKEYKLKPFYVMKIRDTKWKEKFFETLQDYYHRHPYYKETIECLHNCLDDREFENLVDLNTHIIMYLKKIFHINTVLLKASDFHRPRQSSGFTRQIIELLDRVMDTHIYLVNSNTHKYIYKSKDKFNITPYKTIFIQYSSHYNASSWYGRYGLSVIDAMMTHGNKKTEELIKTMNVEYFDFEKNKINELI